VNCISRWARRGRRFPGRSPPGSPGGQQDAWREVEVELKTGTREVLDAAEAGLAVAGARLSRSASKLARVLGTD
jgi:hypothetical protein